MARTVGTSAAVLADDQVLMRAALRMVLKAEVGLDVVGEASDGRVALHLARELRPDVVLMDVRMPELDGIEATRRLLAEPDVTSNVVMLTTLHTDEYVYEALRPERAASCSRTCRRSCSSRASGRSRPVMPVASGQLARPGLAADVLAALARHDVPAAQLAVEITEATALPDPDLARVELDQLVLAGVRVVIDDYGLGWSNLSRVLELPASTLKLDRSIAGAIDSDPRAVLMVRSTVSLATSLGLDVVAEGVETPAARQLLADAGCAWAQGWLFSAAVPGHALPAVLTQLAADAVDLSCRTPAG